MKHFSRLLTGCAALLWVTPNITSARQCSAAQARRCWDSNLLPSAQQSLPQIN